MIEPVEARCRAIPVQALSGTMPSQLLFLPGASGDTRFWKPVADRLAHPAGKCMMGWPGFGPTPPDPRVSAMSGLVQTVVARLDRPTALIAQSMGAVVAILAALERPSLVTHLVLAAASGGLDIARLGGRDWQRGFLQTNKTLPSWFATYRDDLSAEIPSISAPTLLLWGDADPVSPVAAGQRFAALLPHSELHVFAGAGHDLANALADRIAPLIDDHLA